MPMKLNVGASRKVTDNNYGSRGASVNLELELDASLVAEPAKLQDRIRQLFDLVRAAVAEELNGHGTGERNGQGTRPTEHRPGSRNGVGIPPATASQVRALHAIARRQGIELSQFLFDHFQLQRANGLSIRQASAAIDALKAAAVGSDG
jgi:hypothetical protein